MEQGTREKRTLQQNRALHKWFRQISEVCKENGITLPMIMKAARTGMDLEPTPEIIKEIWRFAQRKMFGKESTKDLSKHSEVDRLIDVMTLFFGKFVEVPPFPVKEEIINVDE